MPEMSVTDLSVRELLQAFSAPAPTPGGGSAAALAGAVGAALLHMVARLSKTRHDTGDDRRALDAAASAVASLRDELTALVDRDSEAYAQVVAAYRRPKGTDEERRARSAAIQAALAGAIETPLAVMRAAHAGLGHAATVAACGHRSAASDVEVAVELLLASLRGAERNVAVNLGSIADRDYAARSERDAAAIAAAAGEAAETARGRLA